MNTCRSLFCIIVSSCTTSLSNWFVKCPTTSSFNQKHLLISDQQNIAEFRKKMFVNFAGSVKMKGCVNMKFMQTTFLNDKYICTDPILFHNDK